MKHTKTLIVLLYGLAVLAFGSMIALRHIDAPVFLLQILEGIAGFLVLVATVLVFSGMDRRKKRRRD